MGQLLLTLVTSLIILAMAVLVILVLTRLSANVLRGVGLDLITLYAAWCKARVDARTDQVSLDIETYTRWNTVKLAVVEKRQQIAAEEDRAAAAIRAHRAQLASGQGHTVDLSSIKREEVEVK